MSAPWFELTVDAPRPVAELIANFLIENGAPGLETRDVGERIALVAHFLVPFRVDSLERYCTAIGWQPVHDQDIRVRAVDDQDWAHDWKRHARPQLIGDTLYVCPSWVAERPAHRTILIIDPGMAFGTGQHASTRGCLILLEHRVRRGRIDRALDLGAGSGILAIALAKLGVVEVWAIDTDPIAQAVTSENAAANGVGLRAADCLNEVPHPCDLIVANLFADILEDLATSLVEKLSSNGALICSGFLVADEARVVQAYSQQGMAVNARLEDDAWVSLDLVRV